MNRHDPNNDHCTTNIEIEQGLIGAILLNNNALDLVGDALEPRHFSEPLHAAIYDIAATMIRAGRMVSPLTIRNFLPPDVSVGDLSLSQYLARLAAEATSVINAADYGRGIVDLAQRRALMSVGRDMIDAAQHAPFDHPASAQIEEAERALYALADVGRGGGAFASFADAAAAAIDMAAHAYQRDGTLSGLPTGIRDLDARMGGLQPSDLIIVAGRPGMGKTALATNIATYVASAKERRTVGFFSLEMSSEQLATRVIAERAGVASSQIRRGAIDEDEFARLADASAALASMPLYVDQTGGLSLPKLAARARALKRQHGLDLLVIDYLQLMAAAPRRGGGSETRVQQVTEITMGLKALAKELNVPLIALSQLSRAVEARDDKRPQLSDLRESGSIEQDADVVLFVYREEYYLAGKEPRPGSDEHVRWHAEMAAATGRAELIIGKQRHGPTGTVQVQFDAKLTRFSDLAAEGLADGGRPLDDF